MTLRAPTRAARSRPTAARTELCPSIRTIPGGDFRPAATCEAYRSSGAGSAPARALVDTTERWPVATVTVHEEIDRPEAIGAAELTALIALTALTPSRPSTASAAPAESTASAVTAGSRQSGRSGQSGRAVLSEHSEQSMSSTPHAARSARTKSARGPAPTGAARIARPPRAAKATAALVAGPPAAMIWSRATILSSGAGGASTSWITSTTASPQNRPTGRAAGGGESGAFTLLLDLPMLRRKYHAGRYAVAFPTLS